MKEIMCNGDYFEMYTLLNFKPVNGFKCGRNVGNHEHGTSPLQTHANSYTDDMSRRVMAAAYREASNKMAKHMELAKKHHSSRN